MKVILDQNTLAAIHLFQSLTGSTVIDSSTDDDVIYFVVGKGQYGLAVGKGGIKIKKAERVFKKTIKVFEYADTLEAFVKNMIPEAQEIQIQDKQVHVKIKPNDRSRVIGRGGRNIQIINTFVRRFFDVESLKVK